MGAAVGTHMGIRMEAGMKMGAGMHMELGMRTGTGRGTGTGTGTGMGAGTRMGMGTGTGMGVGMDTDMGQLSNPFQIRWTTREHFFGPLPRSSLTRADVRPSCCWLVTRQPCRSSRDRDTGTGMDDSEKSEGGLGGIMVA